MHVWQQEPRNKTGNLPGPCYAPLDMILSRVSSGRQTIKQEPFTCIEINMFLSLSAIQSWIWAPVPTHLGKWQTLLKAVPRIFAIFIREFSRDNISLRSGALTFTIVLSLVPTLALGTAVLKGLGAGNQMRQAAYKFIDSLESPPLSSEPVILAPQGKIPAEAGTSDSQNPDDAALTGHLRKAADQIFDYVDKTDFATLGAFGIIGLVFSVLSVLGSIERSMNVIWQAKRGRPFGRKLMDYLALMILLPLSVNLALATETTLQNETLFNMLSDLMPIAWLTGFLLKLLPLLLVVGTFTVLYRFLPNTTVRVLPALAGGIFGGTSWLFTQTFYLKLQIGVARYNAIYGSFATLPLFLLWLYIGWLIFLAGAEVAFACQVWRSYSRKSQPMSPQEKLSLAFDILELVYQNFQKGLVENSAEIANKLDHRHDEISRVLFSLTENGLLHHVNDENKSGFVPAIPQNSLILSKVVDAVFGPRPAKENLLAAETFEAAKNYAAGKNLQTMGLEGRKHAY